MAYNGYLIKLLGGSGSEILPFDYIGLDSYKITPNQRLESKAGRATTGYLHRTTVAHTASKIEFSTPPITNINLVELNALLRRHYTDTLQRKLNIEYYDPETDAYKQGTCYMPDVDYNIERIDNTNNIVYYQAVRYAFIEY